MPVIAANALCSDFINRARLFLNDPNPGARWTDPAMINLANSATKTANRDVLFPQARWDIPIISGQGTYQISPAVITTDVVYVNGMILPQSSPDLMQGQQLGVNDQTGTNAVTATGVNIPDGATGIYTPQWISEGPATYPFLGIGASGLAPWYNGYNPVYYWLGGYLGITPAPLGSGYITMFGVPVVPDFVLTTDASYFPINFINAIAWKICELAKFSDDTDRSAEARNYAANQYEKEMRSLRTWNRRRKGDDTATPVVVTNRSYYVRGNNRTFNSGSSSGIWGPYNE